MPFLNVCGNETCSLVSLNHFMNHTQNSPCKFYSNSINLDWPWAILSGYSSTKWIRCKWLLLLQQTIQKVSNMDNWHEPVRSSLMSTCTISMYQVRFDMQIISYLFSFRLLWLKSGYNEGFSECQWEFRRLFMLMVCAFVLWPVTLVCNACIVF